MNKVGFMSQLEGLLADVPPAEREEALQYYNDYFEDAGSENEQAVIKSLGSPRDIAENIKAELSGEVIPQSVGAGEHAITKYGQIVPASEVRDETERGGASENRRQGGAGGFAGFGGQGGAGGAGAMAGKSGNGIPTWAWILIGFFAVTVLLPGAWSVFFGILCAFFGLWFTFVFLFGGSFVALLIGAGIFFFTGIICLAHSIEVFFLLLGVAFMLVCAAILNLMAEAWLIGKVTPAMFRGIKFLGGKIVEFFKGLFGKMGGR